MALKLGLPKGSLQEATFALFAKAGWNIRVESRSYQPTVDDDTLSISLIRPQEISRYLKDGILDAGLTGRDWLKNNDAEVLVRGGQQTIDPALKWNDWVQKDAADMHTVCDLTYSKATRNPIRVVLAVAEKSPIQSPADLHGVRIATEYEALTRLYLQSHGVQNCKVEFSWGADEMKVPTLADAIVVNTETGSSLRAHNLRIVDTLLTSTAQLVCSRAAWADSEKRAQIENMAMLLTGALNAHTLVGLKMNVAQEQLANVVAQLPALKRPTVSPLYEAGWVALEIIIEEKLARDLIPRLKRAGAEGIVEYPLNKVVY